MAETLSLPLGAAASADPEWLRGTRLLQVVRVQTRDRVPDLILRQALEAFDRARSYEEARAARERLLGIGPEVLPSVIAELSETQPPDRFDALLGLLLRWQRPDDAIDLALSEGAGPDLRAAMAEAMARHVEADPGSAEVARRIGSALARLARDPDAGVRITAVEAIGLAGLAGAPELRELLRGVASDDGNDQVRREARQVLGEAE